MQNILALVQGPFILDCYDKLPTVLIVSIFEPFNLSSAEWLILKHRAGLGNPVLQNFDLLSSRWSLVSFVMVYKTPESPFCISHQTLLSTWFVVVLDKQGYFMLLWLCLPFWLVFLGNSYLSLKTLVGSLPCEAFSDSSDVVHCISVLLCTLLSLCVFVRPLGDLQGQRTKSFHLGSQGLMGTR